MSYSDKATIAIVQVVPVIDIGPVLEPIDVPSPGNIAPLPSNLSPPLHTFGVVVEFYDNIIALVKERITQHLHISTVARTK